jgi:hypothetical protein
MISVIRSMSVLPVIVDVAFTTTHLNIMPCHQTKTTLQCAVCLPELS